MNTKTIVMAGMPGVRIKITRPIKVTPAQPKTPVLQKVA